LSPLLEWSKYPYIRGDTAGGEGTYLGRGGIGRGMVGGDIRERDMSLGNIRIAQ